MGLLKWGAIAAIGYSVLKHFGGKAGDYFANNMTFSIAGGRIHKISLSSVDLRLNIDFTNLTPASIKLDSLRIDSYYIKKDGTPDLVAKTTLSAFSIPANETSRINDVKVVIPTTKIITNREIITATERKFKFVCKAKVNGHEFSTTIDYTL